MKSTLKDLLGAVVTLVLPFSVGAASADGYVVTLEQIGPNVVATGSGAINLTGLVLAGTANSNGAVMTPFLGFIDTGPTSSVPLVGFKGITGPTNFGAGSSTLASSGMGNDVEIAGTDPQLGTPILFLPSGYVSESALSDSAIYDFQTFASLGVIPGTYVWTWGTGTDQSFTLEIVPAPIVPAPIVGAGLPGLIFGAGGLLGWMRRKRTVAAV